MKRLCCASILALALLAPAFGQPLISPPRALALPAGVKVFSLPKQGLFLDLYRSGKYVNLDIYDNQRRLARHQRLSPRWARWSEVQVFPLHNQQGQGFALVTYGDDGLHCLAFAPPWKQAPTAGELSKSEFSTTGWNEVGSGFHPTTGYFQLVDTHYSPEDVEGETQTRTSIDTYTYSPGRRTFEKD